MTSFGPLDATYTRSGYLTMYAPWHPLAMRSGQVSVARAVLYSKIGPGPHPCHHCGAEIDWRRGLEADHLNWARLDNSPGNLVPACKSCNQKRRGPK